MQQQINTQSEDAVVLEWMEAYEQQFKSRPKRKYLKCVCGTVSPLSMSKERMLAKLASMQAKMIRMAVNTIDQRLSSGARHLANEMLGAARECRSSRSGSWGRELAHAGK